MNCPLREAEGPEDFRDCARVQRLVWRFDAADVVTPTMLRSCRNWGGIVLLASDASGAVVGFVFSFPAVWGGITIQHSHMLAVQPEYRDQGIGRQLKLAQYARAQGRVPLITWTFDPLEARNGHLNLNRLGVRVRRYYRDLYGRSTASELHQGIGTDRFLAEWYVLDDDQAPTARMPDAALDSTVPRVIHIESGAEGMVLPKAVNLGLRAPELLVEVPLNIQRLKQHEPRLARRWRELTRAAFLSYLEAGYEVVGLDADKREGRTKRRVFYRMAQPKEGSRMGGSVW